MQTFKRGGVVLLVTLASACSGSNPSPSAPSTPSATPTPTTATTVSLTGKVTSNSALTQISGATVSAVDGPNAGKSATTDFSGDYSLTGLQPSGFTINVSANNYVSQSLGVTLTSNQRLSFRLNPPPNFVLTGRATDSISSAPIAGATVSINGRYTSTTDSLGNYSVAGFLDGGNFNLLYVSANNYESDYRYIRGTSQNVRLYRIQRITAGDSTVVTIAPDDTLCVNNSQDFPGLGQDYVCRSVRIVAPTDGIMTLEAISTLGGAHPPLELEIVGGYICCSLRNPSSIQVTAGTELVVSVEMVLGSTTSQSFTLNTSMAQK